MSRILVIDDEPQMRDMLSQTLERAGHEVIEAINGQQGIEFFKKSPTELIITDLIMPGKDGMETIIELKREFPDVKIIAISGGSREMDPRDYLLYVTQVGVARTLIKPFEPNELLDIIKDILTN